MNSKCKAAMKRASIPDCSAGPMSRAMEDRRILTAEIEQLNRTILESGDREMRCVRDIGDEIDGYKAKIESLQAENKGLRAEVAFWLSEGQQERPEVIELQTLTKLSVLDETQTARIRELCEMFRLEHEDQPVLLAKIEELQAVVKQLPKDAEGVPCLPGDERWAWIHPGVGEAVVMLGTVLWRPGGEPEYRIGFGTAAPPLAVGAGYSTQAAARAAGEEGSDDVTT